MADLDGLSKAIEAGDRVTAVALTQAAIDDGLGAQVILDAMTNAMTIVGGRFQRDEIFVPEMLIAARAMKEATARLEPLLVAADIRPEATAILGTVQGDLHDIGKNLVGMMWRGANIEVIDLGVNVPPERYVAAVKEHNASLLGLSALLTTTMGGMRNVVAAIRAAGLTDVKIIVGGAPVTAEFAREIGADGYAPDAGSAVDVAKSMIAA
jgi:5-methyltetrahydrofolate--homocysteine methyltransferase